MCGIAGIIDFRGRPIAEPLPARMAECLAHRGPDDRGTWRAEAPGWSAGLAHTRLAVIDPTPEGHQPMCSADGRWAISYNGELYNFRELARGLAEPPRTACDTEVFLRACIERGPAALADFDGMWAAAVVDSVERTGFHSRHPIRIKPLYYSNEDGRLVFGSELAAVKVALDRHLEIDEEALGWYLLVGYIPHPLTIYRQVRKLPPGHVLRFGPAGVSRPERFFRLSPPLASPPTYPEACEELRGRLLAAVKRQTVADVPLGAFLSGGLDSSVICAALVNAGGPVETFTIGYEGHDRYDESTYARAVATHLGTRHHEFKLGFADVLAAIEPALGGLGEPFADSSLLPTWLVSRETRRQVTVALSGDGGDEVFGGYWRYAGQAWAERYRRLPAVLRREVIGPLSRMAPEARSNQLFDRVRQIRKLVVADDPDPLTRHLAWSRLADEETAGELMGSPALAMTHALQETWRIAAGQWREGSAPGEPIERILLADLAVSLPGDMLAKVDTASMAHALEVRVPLLSPDVVDYVAGLPLAYRIRGTSGKRILRDAFAGLLPGQVLTRRKMGFEVPVGEFLRTELRDMFHDLVSRETLGDLGLSHAAAIKAFDEHAARRRDHSGLLWALLVLGHWHARR